MIMNSFAILPRAGWAKCRCTDTKGKGNLKSLKKILKSQKLNPNYSTNAEVAVKVCIAKLTEKNIKLVKKEADVLKKLNHENITL